MFNSNEVIDKVQKLTINSSTIVSQIVNALFFMFFKLFACERK